MTQQFAMSISGIVADVREFHLAATEANPEACVHECTGRAGLTRRLSRFRLLREEFNEYSEALIENDLEGCLDALIDMTYIIVGTGLIQFGGPRFEAAWEAVHSANMSKRWDDGKFHIREDGKIIKPPGWTSPNIKAIVDAEIVAINGERLQREITFEEVWAQKVEEGYQYGPEALALVRFGWQLARAQQ